MNNLIKCYSTDKISRITIKKDNLSLNERIKEDNKQKNKYKPRQGYYAYFN